MRDTIFALATALGRAAVAVVRLSGPASGDTLRRLSGALPAARYAALRTLRDPQTGAQLDRALVLWFPGPASYTGEDQAEIHLHGGRAVIGAVLQTLTRLGLRPADAGEFTRRAFENGKLDLGEAEGVADLIDAETEGQRRQALAQLTGALAGKEAHWRSLLIEALGLLEASLDFPDEEVPGGVVDQARRVLHSLRVDLVSALGDARGERVREGFRVAIMGLPNAGKSSLLNALAHRDAAIVTAQAGTTRDIIEVALDLAGYQVTLADMAGLRQASDLVEAEGIRRARAWADSAALRLFVVDASDPEDLSWRVEAQALREGDILVLNKMDVAIPANVSAAEAWAIARDVPVVRAAAGSNGVEAVEAILQDRVVKELAALVDPGITRARHRDALRTALERLDGGLEPGRASELLAEDVRLVSRALGRLSGRINSDDILDLVFGAFCIGK
jgi:tRNA modification GTPase